MADVLNDAVAPETHVSEAVESTEQTTGQVVDPTTTTTTLETVTVDDDGNITREIVTVALSEPGAAALAALEATPIIGGEGSTFTGQETATTKEGKPAEAGEKRERPTEVERGKDTTAAAEEQLERTEKETGKDAKKPKVDEPGAREETQAGAQAEAAVGENEKKAPARKGRQAKTSKPVAAPGEEGTKAKRGRPRKNTADAKKGEEEKTAGDETRPVRNTRSTKV